MVRDPSRPHRGRRQAPDCSALGSYRHHSVALVWLFDPFAAGYAHRVDHGLAGLARVDDVVDHGVAGGDVGVDLLADRVPVSYTHLRAHETDSYLVCRL